MAEYAGYSPRNRAERVVAAGRLFLAAFLAVAVFVDPTDPPPYAPVVRQLAIAYVIYAAVIAAVVSKWRAMAPWLSMATHAVDLLLFSAFMQLTLSSESPFFVYFVFATLAGAIRWHGRGAWLTGAVVLGVYVMISVGEYALVGPGRFEANRFIARCTQLTVVTGLVAYLASYQRRLQSEIANLAAWPRHVAAVERDALLEVLTHAGDVLRSPRVVVVWEEGDEPALRVGYRREGEIKVGLEPPGTFGTVVAAPLHQSSFLCMDLDVAAPQVLRRTAGGFSIWRGGAPLDAGFSERFRPTRVLAIRLSSGTISGWLFAFDLRGLSADDLLLGEIVGRLVAGTLELRALVEQLREAAASEERLRLARELHDGVLQSLTAAALQAGRTRRILASDPVEAERRLARLEEVISSEQQALRVAITDLKPGRGAEADLVDAGERIREAAMRIARLWEVKVHVDVESGLLPVSHRLTHEIVRMAQEALVNAIRHGRARAVTLALHAEAGELRLRIEYEGQGFSGFGGRHDLASLNAMKAGPRTLKERISAVQGSLVIHSSEDGARLELAIPVTAAR